MRNEASQHDNQQLSKCYIIPGFCFDVAKDYVRKLITMNLFLALSPKKTWLQELEYELSNQSPNQKS